MMVLQLITIFKKISGNPRKLSENLDGLDQMILKIYICLGIVGDTNFTNFQQLSPIFQTNFTNIYGVISTGSMR